MAEPTWGLLQKAQDDAETIEQAIARLIEAHNDDPTSHTASGQSLETHKSSETIDHLADSIVEDKILDGEVPVPKLNWNKREIQCNFESENGWNFSGDGGYSLRLGSLYISTDEINGTWEEASAYNNLSYVNFASKNPVYQSLVQIDSITNQTIYFGLGQCSIDFMGFKVVNGILYACHNHTSEHLTQITGITLTNFNVYKIIMTSGSKIEFYVNDVLKATHTTDLPNDQFQDYVFDFYIETSEDDFKGLTCSKLAFYQDP